MLGTNRCSSASRFHLARRGMIESPNADRFNEMVCRTTGSSTPMHEHSKFGGPAMNGRRSSTID